MFGILLVGENHIVISCVSEEFAAKTANKLEKYMNVQSGFSLDYSNHKKDEVILIANHMISWPEMSELRKQITQLLKNI